MDLLTREPTGKKEPFQILHTAFIREDKLTPNEWRVYCVLNSFSGCKRVFPSQKTLSKKACLGIATIKRALTRLVELKLLVKINQRYADNRNNTCEYKLIDYMIWVNKRKIPSPMQDIDPQADIKYIPTGYINIQNRFLFCSELNSNEIRIYCDLLTYRYKGLINPSTATLAEHCNISQRLVFETIKSLVEKKLIQREGQTDEENENALLSNKYTVYSYIAWMDNLQKQ